ncbi:hypothetical protein [Staphylococcus agnetis]|uniref:hypothetical protein n=3 Tax=Staphylococcus agnetis TaxID=985762 RepID=UPI000D1B1875|nr:hypothetical protein [Staphylococcus agnetis]MBY7665240.1 hypothetical protein [Staphylococcus agnetis]NJI14445.1 hypothetical protein [Staphylococcus agnetis]PTH69283.1 hypothetical protein BU586_10445 [Staphylococcus agnetis]PTH76041.1 hypothetical protein BU579_11225 [Staphylococcus agnetis]TRW80412.1 hypothetical protein FNK43_09300 [Staphylococcus agnetis]
MINLKKITLATTSFVLLSTLSIPLANEKSNSHIIKSTNEAQAASGWKKLTTKSGNTAAKNLSIKMEASAILAIVGWAAGGGPGVAAAVGAFEPVKAELLGKLKTSYYTDVIYERKTPVGPEWKHEITFYSDKGKKNKVGKANVIEKTNTKNSEYKKY